MTKINKTKQSFFKKKQSWKYFCDFNYFDISFPRKIMSFVEHHTDYLREVWVPIMEEVDKWSLFFEGKGNIKLVFEFCLRCSCSSVMLWEASLILLHVHQSLVGVIITPDPWCLAMEETEEKETIVLLTLWSMQSVPSRRRIRERGTKVWFTSIMNLIQSAGIWRFDVVYIPQYFDLKL